MKHGFRRRLEVRMFDEESLKKIDSKYFNIIMADDRDATIQDIIGTCIVQGIRRNRHL